MEAEGGESKAVTGPRSVRGFSLPSWMGPRVWEPTVLSYPGAGCECGPGAVLTHPIPRLHRLPSLPSGLATRADGPRDTSQRSFFLSSRAATGNTAILFLVSSHLHQTSHIHLQPQLVVSRPCGDAPARKFCRGRWGKPLLHIVPNGTDVTIQHLPTPNTFSNFSG